MAIYIEMQKINQNNDPIFYYVSTNNFNVTEPFFIGIDLTNNYLYFYQKKPFGNPSFSVSLANPIIPEIDWVPSGLIVRILSAVINAHKRGPLGEYISYAV